MAGPGEVDTNAGRVDLRGRRLARLGEQTTLLDYVGGSNPIYVGHADAGSSGKQSDLIWQICKLTYDGNNNVLAVEWAGGTLAYAWKWVDRASFAYS